jgi:hypothetical protein
MPEFNKAKGFAAKFMDRSPFKHGDGTWGGSKSEPKPGDFKAGMEETVRLKQGGLPRYKPLDRSDYPFNTDEEFAKLVAEHDAKEYYKDE